MGVYFIQGVDTKRIKIGKSSNLSRRIGALSTGSAEHLVLLAFSPDASEGELHQKFVHLQHHNEWFCPGSELLEYIEAIKNNSLTELSISNTALVYELMLTDIRKVFERKKAKVISNIDLVKEMLELKEYEYDWSVYKNHGLSVRYLAIALRTFGIQPCHVWLPEGQHRILQRLYRAYYKTDFEEVWRRYGC